ncbi:hypothetical protein HNP38_001859 [Chryseobacterium defluvii]|uniref:Transposase n=1 Tax=Chryseobacterium defluvii TaxID=160396 RepID=A0A840KGA9_9FLAO|nr:helix-turn-helix domain-containing protein [Chryseobacterium defluvii]MBB4806563.1 hypothetical protein [Chryseobacterium defluvii]
MEKLIPDYRRIYTDMILKKYPEKLDNCNMILQKHDLSSLDIIKLNHLIFGYKDQLRSNQKHRSYDQSAILEILKYQKKNELSNMQVANQFKLSRNSLAKWKKLYTV